MYRVFRTLFSLLLLSCISLGISYAQVTTTLIVGTVKDSLGAVIPDAEVTVTDVDRNLSKTAKSNSNGEYRVDFLQTGNYSLSVTSPHFKKYTQTGIVLNAGAPASIEVILTPGDVTETVEVTDAAPLVNTVNAEVGTTVNSTQMVELPLVNRNAYTLLDLTPGVQTNSNTTSFGAPAQVTLINGGSDNGAGSVNYYLDGSPNLSALRNTGNILPNPDVLEEFRVQTSNYGAPYGRFANGIINALVRSGTNTVHGTVFEFIRNDALNARDWNTTVAKPPLRRNQFGATLGGPVLRNRMFFFGSYGGLRQTSSTLLSSSILPTLAEASGDFRNSAVKPINPTTKAAYACNGVTNVICAADQDATAVALLKAYLPTANSTRNGLPSYQGYFVAPTNTDEFLVKGNLTINEKHSLAATYFNTSGYTTARGGSSNVPYSTQESTWRQHNAIVNDTLSLSSNVVNNIWLSYTRVLATRANTPQLSLANFGSTFLPQGTPALPNISITGFFTLGQSISGPTSSNTYAVRDLVTWVRGAHALQFGGEAVLDKALKVTSLTSYGSFSFNGGVTKNAFADFLTGTPSAAQQDAPATVSATTLTTSLFAQDDWRVSQLLTLNFGLRWDVQTPPVDSLNRESSFVPGQQSTVRPNAPVGLVFPGDQGITRGIIGVPFAHFSPRVGFAFDPFGTGRTSIRGGFGIFWGSVSEESWIASGNGVPFAIRYTFSNVSNPNGVKLSNPYNNNPGGNPFPYTGGLYPVGAPVQPTSKNARFPYTYQMNLSVQQQMTSSLGFSLAYVGSLSRNQIFAPDINYPSQTTNYGRSAGIASCANNSSLITPTTSNTQCRRPYQTLGTIYQLGSGQTSSFHSLQATLTKRMSQHISISSYYMWSKSLSSVGLESSGPGGNTVQNANALWEDRGRTDNDYRHLATIAVVWQPDYYAGKSHVLSAVLKGWEISPIVRFASGDPFSVANGVDANLDGLSTDRAQLIGDPSLGGHKFNQWFNTAAFKQNVATAGAPVDGNSARNMLTGPGKKTVDLNLARTFQIVDRLKFQFRAEATNAFNTVNWSNPAATAATSTFGTINTARTMRQVQFGGKFMF